MQIRAAMAALLLTLCTWFVVAPATANASTTETPALSVSGTTRADGNGLGGAGLAALIAAGFLPAFVLITRRRR